MICSRARSSQRTPDGSVGPDFRTFHKNEGRSHTPSRTITDLWIAKPDLRILSSGYWQWTCFAES